ncbi:MAG: hypothetical protein E7594_03165 [Ruminococcaceae bacterium]|nr:hypothetical protein [Oscillospiraceae bacterium]
MKKFLALLLAVLMLSALLVGCADDQTEEQVEDTTAAEEETNILDLLDVPDKKYDGKEFMFLTRDAAEWTTVDIYSEELTSDPINDAVYRRNDAIQTKYDVVILETQTMTAAADLEKDIKGGSGEYQAIVQKLGDCALISTKGYLQNLREVPHMDLDKTWWDQKALEGLSIGNKVYFATGDLLTSDNDGTFIVMFNKSIAEDNGLEDIYELVNNKQWTFQKMYDMSTIAVKDLNGNGKMEHDADVLGTATTSNSGYCMMYAAGIVITAKNDNDVPEYVLDTERAVEAIPLSYQIIGDKNMALNMNSAGGSTDVVENGKMCFGNGHALFFQECMQCVIRLRSYDVEFGVVPFPMFNEEQGEYYSHMNEVGGMVCIPTSVVDQELEDVGAIIETMAAYSVDTLTPAYYDISLISKSTRDEESRPMIELILANRIYDLGYVFEQAWGGYVGQIAGKFIDGKTNVASTKPNSFKKQMDKTLKKFDIDTD